MNIIKQFECAIYKFREYPKLMELKIINPLMYLFIGVIISVGIMSVTVIYPVYESLGGVTGIINRIPEFEIENGKLHMDKIDYTDEDLGVRVYVDTESKINESMVEGTQMALLADADRYIFTNGIQKQETKFSDFKEDINKETLLATVPIIKIGIIIGGFAVVAFAYLTALIEAWFFAMIANLMNVFMGARMKLSELFKLGIYAMTMPSVLKIVLTLFGVYMNGFVFGGVVIAYIYIVLKNIRSEKGVLLAKLDEK